MMTTSATTSFDVHMKGLLADGFVAGAPTREAAEIDSDVCAGADCSGCRRLGLEYRPFFRPARRDSESCYIALAVCSACGLVEEF
jgi:hypothetical protein